jgi:coenzyme PQQ precursor peptide PqqA
MKRARGNLPGAGYGPSEGGEAGQCPLSKGTASINYTGTRGSATSIAGSAHRVSKKEATMAWTTPTLVEICIGLEINGYLPAEF